ncbi:hypothetical protein D3C78_1412960 [compost metagenome]
MSAVFAQVRLDEFRKTRVLHDVLKRRLRVLRSRLLQLVGITQGEVLQVLEFQTLLLVPSQNLVLVCNLTVNTSQDRVESLDLSLEPSGVLLALSLLLDGVFFTSLGILLHLEFEDVTNL